MMIVPFRAIIKARIDKDISRYIPVEFKHKGIFPFQFCTTVSGITIETSLPTNHITEFPVQVYGDFRTYIMQLMFSFIKSKSIAAGVSKLKPVLKSSS